MEESTSLSRLFAEQGLKIRIRKDIRTRRKPSRRQQLVENTVAQMEVESHVLTDSSLPSRTEGESNITSNSLAVKQTHIITSPLHADKASIPRSPPPIITLPRIVLDTQGRNLIPWQNPDEKVSLPPITPRQSINDPFTTFHYYSASSSPQSSSLSEQGFVSARNDRAKPPQEYDYSHVPHTTYEANSSSSHQPLRHQDSSTHNETYPDPYRLPGNSLKRRR
jgi:hypothetical protein